MNVALENLRGLYTPVIAGEAFRYLINHGNFGVAQPEGQNNTVPLIDLLPMAAQGYLLRNTMVMLLFIYIHVNNLEGALVPTPLDTGGRAHSDTLMMEAFGGIIPATFYAYRDEGGHITRLSMNAAIERGLINAPMNTYQILESLYPLGTANKRVKDLGFRPDNFKTFRFQSITAPNYYTRNDLNDDPIFNETKLAIDSEEVRDQMRREYEITKSVSAQWHEALEPERRITRGIRRGQQVPILQQQVPILQQQVPILQQQVPILTLTPNNVPNPEIQLAMETYQNNNEIINANKIENDFRRAGSEISPEELRNFREVLLGRTKGDNLIIQVRIENQPILYSVINNKILRVLFYRNNMPW